ncbi:uncharacterized protein LOC26530070 isoform X2 [Drosophila willistoni]|uniref:uncharacterized protein LOC26530070 isoform X2 n=1 Tax=Drosophila willistoni TaxID=7260 RepID=UPI000C26C427|nr:uncharacterized protein LOC26530070 isoform X2 [Drosophila willistoni]
MKSHKLHKFQMLLMLTMIAASAWSQPYIKPEALPTLTSSSHQAPVQSIHQPFLVIQNNVKNLQDLKDYEIRIPKAPQQNEPCLTITWKTNPDGSGPDDPKIYYVDGYFRIMPSIRERGQQQQQQRQPEQNQRQ